MGKYFISLNGKIIKIYKSESRARERFSSLVETLTFADSLDKIAQNPCCILSVYPCDVVFHCLKYE